MRMTLNPALSSARLSSIGAKISGEASIRRTIDWAFFLIVLTLVSAILFWRMLLMSIVVYSDYSVTRYGLGFWVLIGPILGGFVMQAIFKEPQRAGLLSPVFAVLMGSSLGAIAGIFERALPGLILQTVAANLFSFFGTLLFYRMRILRVTEPYIRFGFALTSALLAAYSTDVLLGILFAEWIPLFSARPVVICAQFILVFIGILVLAADFKIIEENVEQNAPAYMEKYAAFAAVTSLLWNITAVHFLIAKIRKD